MVVVTMVEVADQAVVAVPAAVPEAALAAAHVLVQAALVVVVLDS